MFTVRCIAGRWWIVALSDHPHDEARMGPEAER
jgi:hypothetical protein